MNQKLRITSFVTFGLLAVVSIFYCFRLQFSFDFEQFFPQGDPDLEFFKEFIQDFEADDNFLLVAVAREEGVFEQSFLERFHQLSIDAKSLPYVLESQSLTKFSYPLKTPFGITTLPAIHLQDTSRYAADRKRILEDERFPYNFISADATSMLIFLKTEESMELEASQTLMAELTTMVEGFGFEDYHFLGRAYFVQELVDMRKREIEVSAIISGLLVTFIMFLIFRKPWGIFIALSSVGLGMLLFMGFLGVTGRELNVMAALYPVLMIIVGTSDVVHIMSKYVDELRKGLPKKEALRITVREIGLATLLTSVTTAVGFATLATSKTLPIRDFGINASIGVLIAYITVIFFTTALLSFFRADQIVKQGRGDAFWSKWMTRLYHFTLIRPRRIAWGSLLALVICVVGISQITTNYTIMDNLPRGEKITSDLIFFEKNYTGFRPMELAVFPQGDRSVYDYQVLREMDKMEQYLAGYPQIRAIQSATGLYKSINRMYRNNQAEAYVFPPTEERFAQYQKLVAEVPQFSSNILVSKDEKKARITTRILDMGADSIKSLGATIDQWALENTDTAVVKFRRTGTGLIIDKNAEYIQQSLLTGLALAIGIVCLLMALLFRDWRMLFISLVPNIFPLLVAGALLGYIGIELEAGVSIVFAVIFGIAVDDTIHFLSKYKLARNKGLDQEAALLITFQETGKAIVLTTIILFFGFLVMLFSIHPPSVTVGLLISVTLVSALFSDVLLIPVLIRWVMKE